LERDIAFAEQAAAMDVNDVSRNFRQRRQKMARGRWTWRMRRRARWISSLPDYILARESTQKIFVNCGIRMSAQHDSDHRAVIATIKGGDSNWVKHYKRRRSRLLVHIPRIGPRWERDAEFETLKNQINKPTVREGRLNNWISASTWELIDKRVGVRQEGDGNQTTL
jgi:hypothetical protein